MPNQLQMFYQEQRKIAEGNDAFLFLVKEGMTRAELLRNITRRPSTWARFSAWVEVLPVTTSASTAFAGSPRLS
jgi:hypothetical protein